MDLTIGALARAAGIPTSTLRTWERRYGFPAARRTAGNQRLYDADTVDRLRLVARAIGAGHRPAQVVAASPEELRALAADVAPPVVASTADGAPFLAAVGALDGDALTRGFAGGLARLGLTAFLDEVAAPFCEAVGDAWREGRLAPWQEHFASERLRETLAAQWRPLSEVNRGGVAVLATLPGERHVLGLHMAACLAAAAGWRLVFLGAETPPPDLDACARRVDARAVLVSVSASADRTGTAWSLSGLRARLPAHVRMLIGGAGAPEPSAWDARPGDERFATLADFSRFLGG